MHYCHISHSLKTWFLNLPCLNSVASTQSSQLSRLQLSLNSTARAVSKTPKCSHITPILKSLPLLKIEQKIQYKVISFTYKTLQFNKPNYFNDLLHIQRNRNTRNSDIVTLQRPSVCFNLKLTDRSFRHYAPVLWNSLPKQLRQPMLHQPSINQTFSTLALSSSQFHAKLKTFLLNRSFLP